MVGGVMLTALLFELLDAKSGDIKTWVKGRLEDTTFITKINTTVENTITKVFSKADQFALLSGKVEKVLESLKANLSEEAFEYLANNLKKDQISDLMEAVRKLEKELGSTEIKLSEAQVKKLLEGLKDGKGVDSMVAELKTWCESGGKYTESEIKDILNNIKGDGFKNNPLRQAYENEVRALKEYGEQLLADGMSEEQVARMLNQARRDLGVKYKDMTPQPLRDYIYDINMGRYGDKLGPTYKYLREEKGRSNMDIIKSSSRPNMNVDELLSGFEEWLWRQ